MQPHSVDAIKSHPRYQELVCSRKCFAWNLTILMLVIYYGFILIIAFAPSLLGIPIAEGAVTTVGIPIGVAIIVSAFVLTGIYVARANNRFDALTKAIREDLQ
ncbi:DUF485 domain-containing protein [Thermochromatium tepidum]|uniref:DUF485 domain-containing protein n=1 Tax=Thermochromatium tepidum ATCC 43061 TaxID=316276 RepID=A0A6I6EFP1_THETI|nr:DUF485 domain-containing protein [Thermochromatium tepidum]QGU32157.1 DUF485 domain-containing protein [Thermochromatium tepidum ATCC 43061]